MGTKHDLYWQEARKFISHHNNPLSSSVSQSTSKQPINSAQAFKSHNRTSLDDTEPSVNWIDSRFKEFNIKSDVMDPDILSASGRVSSVQSHSYIQEMPATICMQVPRLAADFEMEQVWNNSEIKEQTSIHQTSYQRDGVNMAYNNRTNNYKPEPIAITTSQTDIELAADEIYDLYLPQIYAKEPPSNLILQPEGMDVKQTAKLRLLRLKNQLMH